MSEEQAHWNPAGTVLEPAHRSKLVDRPVMRLAHTMSGSVEAFSTSLIGAPINWVSRGCSPSCMGTGRRRYARKQASRTCGSSLRQPVKTAAPVVSVGLKQADL